MSDGTRSRWSGLAIAAAAVIVLLLSYAGAYWSMMRPYDFGALVVPIYGRPWSEEPIDEQTHDTVERFFAPLHRLDRRLRPQTWQPQAAP